MISRLVFASMKLAIERDSYPNASGYQNVEKPSSSTLLSKRLSPTPSKPVDRIPNAQPSQWLHLELPDASIKSA